MNKKSILIILFFTGIFNTTLLGVSFDSLYGLNDTIYHRISEDSTANKCDSLTKTCTYNFITKDGHFIHGKELQQRLDSLTNHRLSLSDSLFYYSDRLQLPLIFKGPNIKPLIREVSRKVSLKEIQPNFLNYHHFNQPHSFTIENLRANLQNQISKEHADWYTATLDQLPNTNTFLQRRISSKPIGNVAITGHLPKPEERKIEVGNINKMYWQKSATALFQFTQNYISGNWYQGGNSNMALLSILKGTLNYDNLKNIQWENSLEWRAGFNSVEGDTLRKAATNDDNLKLNSKFGIKASGNWYYSLSGEFSTTLFDNYKAVNSKIMTARLFTPVRTNISLGLDYKYKKVFSLLLAPISYKYIYVNDTVHVNPNLFGIVTGENHLSQLGSSFQSELTYTLIPNWTINSKLTFYTNYTKVEIDWETINNFTFNRYISARFSLHPRYDNTIILKAGQKNKIQFKQLLSIGLSIRLI